VGTVESASPSEASPTVSVLALSYNHERFVDESLDAIAAQTYGDFELIIVDDCSTDDTAQRVQGWLERTTFPATFVRNENNLGVSESRNLGLSLARGEYVCTAATDDAYEPSRLEHQVACFSREGPGVAAVYGEVVTVDEQGSVLPDDDQRWLSTGSPSGEVFEELLRENFIPSPATMMRRSCIEEVGGWDESVILDDWDLLLRLADRHRIVHCPGVAARYRMTTTGLSRDPDRAVERSRSVVRIMLKWLDRDDGTAGYAARRAWQSALAVVEIDRAAGVALLHQICESAPTRRRRIELALASTPLGPSLVRAARRSPKLLRRPAPSRSR
jgi:glycosyltransferase involved in cell wall biosynthesis